MHTRAGRIAMTPACYESVHPQQQSSDDLNVSQLPASKNSIVFPLFYV